MRLDTLRVCVTGGMGYVGSHTAKALKAAGAEVIVVDCREVEQNKLDGVEYIYSDYADPELWRTIAECGYVDGIVHCAGTSLVGPSVTDPAKYYTNNVAGTISMLDELKEWDDKPFIVFSSSAAVYGNPVQIDPVTMEPIPFKRLTESMTPHPCNPYGRTKLMIEQILKDYDSAYKIKYFAFRYFNAAGADIWDHQLGPEEGDTHIIPRIFDAYYNNEPFYLYGTDYDTVDGTCLRDYIHVCDLAEAHKLACRVLALGSQSKIYNLGTGYGYTNQYLLDVFERVVGRVEVLHKSRREGDPDALVADSSLFKAEHKLTPKYSNLADIMISFKEYYDAKRTRKG